MDNTTLSVFLIALSAMVKVALISGVGVWISIYPSSEPLLSPTILKRLSALTTVVFVPALVVHSLGSSVSLELLQRFGILIFLSLLIIFVSYANTYALRWMHEGDPKLFLAVLVAAGSPNAISMPLLVMKTICEDATVNADYDDDSIVCFNEATSMLFIYQIGWHVVYWSCGYPLLKSLDNDCNDEVRERGHVIELDQTAVNVDTTVMYSGEGYEHSSEEGKAKNEWIKEIINNFILSPCMIAIYIGIGIGLIPYLQEWLFYEVSVIRPLGSAVATLGEPVVCVNTLIMSASLAQVYIKLKKQKERGKYNSEEANKDDDFDSSNEGRRIEFEGYENVIVAKSLDINDVDNGQIQHARTGKDNSEHIEFCDWFQVTQTTFCATENEYQKSMDINMMIPQEPEPQMKDVKDAIEEIKIPHLRSTCVMILGRLIIPSVIMLAFMELFLELKLISKEERLMRLLIVIEAAVPSAQMIIVSLNQVGGVQIASQISYMYVFQYSLSIFTITFFTTLGMRIIYA